VLEIIITREYPCKRDPLAPNINPFIEYLTNLIQMYHPNGGVLLAGVVIW
jgi:hypothetical protein